MVCEENIYAARRRACSRVRPTLSLHICAYSLTDHHSQPGKYRIEWRGVADADDLRHSRVHVSFRCEEDCYTLTGILLAHTALAILFDPDTAAREMRGGILTPSTVATESYFGALEKAGVFVEVKMLE